MNEAEITLSVRTELEGVKASLESIISQPNLRKLHDSTHHNNTTRESIQTTLSFQYIFFSIMYNGITKSQFIKII